MVGARVRRQQVAYAKGRVTRSTHSLLTPTIREFARHTLTCLGEPTGSAPPFVIAGLGTVFTKANPSCDVLRN